MVGVMTDGRWRVQNWSREREESERWIFLVLVEGRKEGRKEGKTAKFTLAPRRTRLDATTAQSPSPSFSRRSLPALHCATAACVDTDEKESFGQGVEGKIMYLKPNCTLLD